MQLRRDHQPARVALVIFIALVLFCVAQLSWWIIFQIRSSAERQEMSRQSFRGQAVMAVALVNHEWARLTDRARSSLEQNRHDRARLTDEFESLLAGPAVAGYRVVLTDKDLTIQNGATDSTFYGTLAEGAIIYLDRSYPEQMLRTVDSSLRFTVAGYHDGSASQWVGPEMYSLSPAVMNRLDEKTHRTVTMFAAEGGFFFLIMLFGAYLIYRTLYRAEELKFAQQNFVHAVTHELKAPLASIKLYLQTIMGGKVEPGKTKELFPKMIEDCDRLEGLIDNVLEAGHFTKSGYQLKLSPADLSDDLNEYLNGLESLVHRHGGSIARSIKAGVSVKSDYQALRRVINALIDNALKYSPAGRRDIAVELDSDGRWCTISVRDQGQGIEAGEERMIFERFYRGDSDSSRRVTGTGLGLFLVKEIVDAHGGRVGVQSAGRGKGTIFVLTLPVVSE